MKLQSNVNSLAKIVQEAENAGEIRSAEDGQEGERAHVGETFQEISHEKSAVGIEDQNVVGHPRKRLHISISKVDGAESHQEDWRGQSHHEQKDEDAVRAVLEELLRSGHFEKSFGSGLTHSCSCSKTSEQ